jgi:hypothetical protein
LFLTYFNPHFSASVFLCSQSSHSQDSKARADRPRVLSSFCVAGQACAHKSSASRTFPIAEGSQHNAE